MNPFAGRPARPVHVVDVKIETGDSMALEVTVTIKSGSGHGAPWHVVKGSPDEVAGYLGLHGEDWDGKGSTLQAQLHRVAAWASEDFDSLNPGKG